MFHLAFYHGFGNCAGSDGDAIKLVASRHDGNGLSSVITVADVDEDQASTFFLDRLNVDPDCSGRMDIFSIPRAFGIWLPDYKRWVAEFTSDIAHDDREEALVDGGSFPFLCRSARISDQPIPPDVQLDHKNYVARRAANLLLGGWLVRKGSFGSGEYLPDVCGIYVYRSASFEEADGLSLQDPTARARYWVPTPFIVN